MAVPTRVVQPGVGDVRPLFVLYHYTMQLDKRITVELSQRCCVVNFTAPPFVGAYRTFSHDGMQRLDHLLESLGPRVGTTYFSPIILAGFSEGCQGVRSQLAAEMWPAGTICCDGIHASRPIRQGYLTLWREWFKRCGARFDLPSAVPPDPERPTALVSVSQIVPPTYAGTRETIDAITGWDMEPGSYTHPHIRQSGNFEVWSYPGGDAQAHIYQAKNVMPKLVADMAYRYDLKPGDPMPPGRSVSNGPLPPPPPPPAKPPPSRTGPKYIANHWGRRVGVAAAAGAAAFGTHYLLSR